MHNSGFTRISDILPEILRKTGIQRKLEEQEILALWGEVVGEEIAARSKASKFARGILYVYVEHGAWMQELHFMEKEIIRKIQAKAPGIKIKAIRFSGKKRN